jgi:hypothetical protein
MGGEQMEIEEARLGVHQVIEACHKGGRGVAVEALAGGQRGHDLPLRMLTSHDDLF